MAKTTTSARPSVCVGCSPDDREAQIELSISGEVDVYDSCWICGPEQSVDEPDTQLP